MKESKKKSMKVLQMRCGSDEGGLACGPVGGSDYVELLIMTADGALHFVTVSRMEQFENAYVSDFPLLDVLTQLGSSEVDFDAEMDKVENAAEFRFSYEVDELPEELLSSPYLPAVKLIRFAFFNRNVFDFLQLYEVDDFLKPFQGKDISTISIPEPAFDEDGEPYQEEFAWSAITPDGTKHSGSIFLDLTKSEREAIEKYRESRSDEEREQGIDLEKIPGCERLCQMAKMMLEIGEEDESSTEEETVFTIPADDEE